VRKNLHPLASEEENQFSVDDSAGFPAAVRPGGEGNCQGE
jgi:hypothetical protein